MVLKDEVDALAGKIREGISKHGCHILYKADLERFFRDNHQPDEEMRSAVSEFAQRYGFKAQLSVKQMTAMFR